LLVERVRRGCKQNRIDDDGVAEFGSGSWEAFREALTESAALNNRSDRSRGNIVACFRALADVCEMTEQSFREEVARNAPAAHHETEGSANGGGNWREWSFPIGREEQGKVVCARVSISDDFRPGDFRRLAEILQMMDIPAPGSGKPG
jgi:hypothetical protein